MRIVLAAGGRQRHDPPVFQLKESLLAGLLGRFVAGVGAQIQQALDWHRPANWRGRLRAWVGPGIGAYLERVALHGMVFHEYRPRIAV